MVGGEARIADGKLRQAILVVVAECRDRRIATAPGFRNLGDIPVPVVGDGGGEGAPAVQDLRESAHNIVGVAIVVRRQPVIEAHCCFNCHSPAPSIHYKQLQTILHSRYSNMVKYKVETYRER